MAGYSGVSMSNNAVTAYHEGKKPLSKISKEDIFKHGVNESITFFRWYVKNCCPSCEWHHTSPKFNQTSFYDIEECCNRFKRFDINELKNRYKSQSKPKTNKILEDKPYYAKVEYSISTYTGKRKYITQYAIIHKCWAYFNDDYKKKISRMKIDGKHFQISERYPSRPNEMPEELAQVILEKINVQ